VDGIGKVVADKIRWAVKEEMKPYSGIDLQASVDKLDRKML
jgi:hypothetical protein